jgi:APA family basic amino acid/polyamine antiporter
MIAWLLTLLYQIGASVVVVSWSNLFLYFIDLISGYNITSSLVEAPVAWSADLNTFYRTDQVINLPAIIIIILLTLLLIIGIRETALVNFVLVVIKVIILLIFIITGSIHIDRKNYTPFFPPSQGRKI